jgi:DNA-binding SARP family transcriptional activator/class 3 adenylate cyclase
VGVNETVTGPVTVLFTDVEGSTELHTRLGDAAAREILRAQERLVRHHVEAHGGREVKALGDGFMVAFASTRAALACAVAIQAELDTQPHAAGGAPVRVRMGLNAGEVTEERQDLFGAAVAAAARIAAKAEGGEILVADVVRQLAGVVPGLRFHDRGPFDLKGFPNPVRLHEVLWREETAQFGLLGPLEVSIGGRPVNLGGSTPRTLLAMLLLRLGEVVPTDALIEGLWGDRAPPSATNSLHSHLSRLRRVLGSSQDGNGGSGFRVLRHGAGYVLEGDGERVDARRFERLVEAGRRTLATGDAASAGSLLRQALGLWRGPVLADFADAPFAQAEAVRLDELRLAVTEELVDVELDLGSHASLVPQLEALVAAHPLRERLWGQLMVALYRAGRQADALRAYQRVRDVLVEELGIEPGPALRHLEDQILRQATELEAPEGTGQPSVATAAAAISPALPPGVTRDAFVGREGELAQLDEALADAIAGEGRLVLVEGEAGMGKTALVEHFAARARAGGATVCFGRAWEDEGAPPFWPWVEVVRARLEQSGRPGDPTAVDLGQLLPEAAAPADSVAAIDPAQARFRLFEAVARSLTERSGASSGTAVPERPTTPVVVILENFHGTDPPSLQLLRFLARRLGGLRLLVVVTYRPVAVERSALGEVVVELGREAGTRRLTVPPLSDEDVGRFLEARLGASVPSSVVASIQRRSEGHAFFLTEMVRLLRADGRPGGSDGFPAGALEIPQSVSEMIGRRLAALSDDATRVLMTASVIGREFDLRLLEHVASLPADAVLDTVEEAAGARLVEELPGAALAYRFGHALVREALYERQSTARRTMLHARIADAMEAFVAGPAEDRLSELAYHRCASVTEGGADRAVAAASRAAGVAAGRLAYEEATRLYRLALDTLDRHGGDPALRGPLLLGLGDAQQRAGDVTAARESMLGAAALARSGGDGHLLARSALGLGGAFEARLFDAELVDLLDEALAGLPPGLPAVRARLLARLSMALHLNDPLGRRAQLSEEALELARTFGDTGLLASCLSARFFALWGPGHTEERLQAAAETLRLAEEQGDRELALDGLTWTIMELVEQGDRGALELRLARHHELAETLRHPLHCYYAQMWQAMLAALDGRFAEAEERARRTAAQGEHLTDLAFPRRSMLLLTVYRDQGRLEELADDVDAVVERYPLFHVWRVYHALLRLELGEEGPARRVLSEMGANPAEAVPREGNWAFGMVGLAELCGALGDAAPAARLSEVLAPYGDRCAMVRFAVACWGSVARSLGLLSTLLEDWDGAVRHFEAAIDRNTALGARPFLARTQYDFARMLARRGGPGDGERAGQLLEAAGATSVELGMGPLASACKESTRAK